MAKCNKKKKIKSSWRQGVANAEENGMVEQEDASVAAAVLTLEGTPESQNEEKEEGKAKESVMAGQETTTTVRSDLEGAIKFKKRKKKAKETAVDEPELSTAISELEGTKKDEVKGENGNETGLAGHTTTTAVSDLEGALNCKKRKKKAKEAAVDEPEPSTVISDSEGSLKLKKTKKKAKETAVDELEPSTVISDLEEALKSKKRKKKAKETTGDEPEPSTVISDLEEALKSKKRKKKAKETTVDEPEPSTVISDLERALKCKKRKKKAKETTVDEPEPSTVISALEGTKKHKVKGENGNETGLAEQETTAAVSASEGTTKHKRRKKNKMQKQQESTLTLSGLVAVDVANKPGNGGTNGEGTSGDADGSMERINMEDPCSKANDSDDKVNCKSQEGNKNCTEKFCLFHEGSEDRKRQIKREKGKRKQNASRDTSPQDGDRTSNPCLDSSCLVPAPAHKEEVKNIYSPKGSLIRFKRKKLLILDLNGLLADIINADKQNEHLAHGKVRGKLVFKRPYCDEFLRFCFQHFELGIWSSRKMQNVNAVVHILMRDLKQYLLFCWDMSKCTFTGCNVIGNNHKPLVLKELKKLWNKEYPNLPWEQGEFSPSNTLLVDDSPYKALCNPPHTAIFPQPYSYLNQRHDCSLGPGGDLRVYLERLAAADDVQVFVRDNPFGQPSIMESDPGWDFYSKIVQRVEQGSRLKWYHRR